MQQNFKLKPLSAAVIGAMWVISPTIYAYNVNSGAETTALATIGKGEVVEKITNVTPTNKEAGITGTRNRDGDPVRVI